MLANKSAVALAIADADTNRPFTLLLLKNKITAH
jgi:hypothetical protein